MAKVVEWGVSAGIKPVIAELTCRDNPESFAGIGTHHASPVAKHIDKAPFAAVLEKDALDVRISECEGVGTQVIGQRFGEKIVGHKAEVQAEAFGIKLVVNGRMNLAIAPLRTERLDVGNAGHEFMSAADRIVKSEADCRRETDTEKRLGILVRMVDFAVVEVHDKVHVIKKLTIGRLTIRRLIGRLGIGKTNAQKQYNYCETIFQ